LNDMIYTGSSAPVNSWLNQTYGGLTVGRQYALRIMRGQGFAASFGAADDRLPSRGTR
jgi:hypothetical protein